MLLQEKFSLSKRYEVFATPFAFVLDEQGVVASKGIVGSAEYLGYVLAGVGNRDKKHHDDSERDSAVEPASESSSLSKELSHV